MSKMNIAVKIIIGMTLLVSITSNVYLYKQVDLWEQSLHQQASSSFYIEQLFIESNDDLSIENVALMFEQHKYFKNRYEIIDTEEIYIKDGGIDNKCIKIDDAILLFKNNKFVGTKVFIPNSIERWLTNEILQAH